MCIYVYIHMHIHIYIYIYIYTRLVFCGRQESLRDLADLLTSASKQRSAASGQTHVICSSAATHDEVTKSVIWKSMFKTPYHKTNIVLRQKTIFIIQNLLYNKQLFLTKNDIVFAVRGFEHISSNYRLSNFVDTSPYMLQCVLYAYILPHVATCCHICPQLRLYPHKPIIQKILYLIRSCNYRLVEFIGLIMFNWLL